VSVRIEAGGRIRTVEVRRRHNRLVVSVDGREHTVDVNEVAGTWSFLVGPAEDGGHASTTGDPAAGTEPGPCAGTEKTGPGFSPPTRSYEVAFVEALDGAMMVHVDGQAIPVMVDSARRTWGARSSGAGVGATGGPAGPYRIVAPMPGKIVKLLVKTGDRVQPRQGIVVVEAMKMENELRSQKAGTVSEVRVKEGALVEAGAILVIVE
jgi:biotin carboxyl carrier protein